MVSSVDERTFTQEVLESSTPVLVNFWAPWCGLCRCIDPLLARLQAVWGQQIKLVRVNADESLKLAADYQLTTLPTLLLFESGQLRYRLDSFHGQEDLRAAIETIYSSLSLLGLTS